MTTSQPNTILPHKLEKVLSQNSEPLTIFAELLPALGEELKCDRIFLYARNPQTQSGKVVYCWRRTLEIPDVDDYEWKKEPESLPQEDPLFAAALHTKPSVFVEDVETSNIEVVNKDFEQKTFGHRALIHAHLCQDDLLWGILQPSVFGKPRVWDKRDRSLIAQIEARITPVVIRYIKEMQK